MININNFLNELGFEINENKVNRFLEKAGIRNNLMRSETVKGAFSKLSDEDKQNVIDTLNETQAFFDNVFGTQSKKWTVDDLSGAYVNIQKPVNTDAKCKNNNCTCDNKPKNEQNTKNASVAEILRREAAAKKEAEKATKTKELIDAVVAKAVEKFSDTKAHKYTVETDSCGNPIAYTEVRLLTEDGVELASSGEFKNTVAKAITEHTGAKKTTIEVMTSPNNNYLRIGLLL